MDLPSATCYYRDGTIAEDDIPCPNSNICCPPGNTCMDNNICRDQNNFANGSTVTFPGGTYNYTDLYHTSSCQSKSYEDCSIQCTTYSSNSGEYIWACNSDLTSYCCHLDSERLGQYDCCSNGTFSLPSPKPLRDEQSTSTSTSSTTTITLTATTTTNTSSPSLSTTSDFTSTESSPVEQTPSGSLSTNAKAGIGVGVAVAGIIIITLVVLLIRARRNMIRTRGKWALETPAGIGDRPEMDGRGVKPPPSELGVEQPSRVYELGL